MGKTIPGGFCKARRVICITFLEMDIYRKFVFTFWAYGRVLTFLFGKTEGRFARRAFAIPVRFYVAQPQIGCFACVFYNFPYIIKLFAFQGAAVHVFGKNPKNQVHQNKQHQNLQNRRSEKQVDSSQDQVKDQQRKAQPVNPISAGHKGQ